MGIFGWSGGGSNTLNAMFRYPQIYRTGMSVAPVPDQRLYDAIYQERYMRTVEENPEGYRDGSPITYAKNLQGHLLLVHGTGDDNVHYQGTELLINELVKHNKPFTMMAYPNRSHGIYEGEGTTRHLFGLLTRYLIEHLPPGPE
jgi:dipeptidyl-peptidase-4